MRSGARSPARARNGLPSENYYVPAPPVVDEARAERIRRTAAAGQAVRAARKARGLSQEALARQAGVSTGRVSELERGNHLPPPEILAALAEALGLSVTGLVPPPGGAGTAGSPVPGPAGPPRDTLRTPVSGAVREGPSLPLSPPAAAGTGTPEHPHPAAIGGQPGAGLDAGAAAGTGETPLAVPASTPRTWIIEMEPGTPIISANHRMNRYALNRRVKDLHERIGKFIAYRDKVPPLGRAFITVEYFSPPRLKRLRHPLASDCITDEDNLAPTAKALVDGIVRAGVLKNDTKHYARSRCVLAGETHPRGLLRVTISEVAGNG